MRRVWAVFLFAFGPLRQTGGVLTWWPTVLSAVTAIAAVIGVAVPERVGGYWLAIAALVGVCVVLFVAAYRLHRSAFPDFPPHHVRFGTPMYIQSNEKSAERWEDDLILFDVTFQSRHSRRMAVEFQLSWQMTRETDHGERVLGPYSGTAKTGPLGRLDVLNQPIELGPEGRSEGLLAFTVLPMVGIEADEHHGVIAHEGASLFVRVIDHVSGAETKEPLEVRPFVEPAETKAEAPAE
jgi:hypothetical protein